MTAFEQQGRRYGTRHILGALGLPLQGKAPGLSKGSQVVCESFP